MRNRFFFIILASLVLATVGINFVHVYFFKHQRLKLIDRQISESSESLLGSPEIRKAVEIPESMENKITQVLGSARIGKVFVLRGLDAKTLYQSENLNLLQIELPMQPEWVTVETGDQFVRLRNNRIDGKNDAVLQVGLVLDRNFINWEILDSRVVNYIVGIVITLFVASVLLTLILLSPLRVLISHLSSATADLSNLKDVKPLPGLLTKYTAGFWAASDEFSNLISAIQKLITRINQNYKLTRSWTLQMAHELKTPLAVMTAVTESNVKAGRVPESFATDVKAEIRQMSGIINDFLDWAELESSETQKDLHAIKVAKAVRSLTSRIEKLEPDRLEVNMNGEFSVFANPSHLDQLLTNLVTNALKFSPKERPVRIMLMDRVLSIRDFGPGIPAEVLERLGEPFNVGTYEDDRAVGTGLGLAWVSTVSRLYGWKFEINTLRDGTETLIRFPKEPL